MDLKLLGEILRILALAVPPAYVEDLAAKLDKLETGGTVPAKQQKLDTAATAATAGDRPKALFTPVT